MPERESRAVAKGALSIAQTSSRQEEDHLKAVLAKAGVVAVGVDLGGEFSSSIGKIVERAVVAAKREGVINPTHAEEGAVAGATHEALMQILPRAMGLNVGGKLGVARRGEHLSVAIFVSIGLLHLDDVAIGLSHRAISR
jgi:hypothetical protein